MCGIAGLIESEGVAAQYLPCVSAMTEALRHRGPDDAGVEVVSRAAPAAVFGHRRLSIIDLSPAGHQPMQDAITGNWITFNGEIYNYQDLRRQLQSKGETFRTNTDTEVILKAYAVWGSDFVTKLRGIFSFGIWDAPARRLFLVRDHLGVKPLYYCHLGNRLLFASEVRALLVSNTPGRELDQHALWSYLAYGSVQEPLTLVRSIKSLLPGHYLTYTDNEISITRYWRLPTPDQIAATPPANAVEKTAAKLAEAVRIQLVSDVPLGAFLSGGIDSTAIAALAERAATDTLKTFSIVFEETKYDERIYSRKAADHIGTDHTELHLTGEIVRNALPVAINAFDQPSVDGLNTYFVSQVTRAAGLTVALSGVGGDELFGGYGGYAKPLRAERWARRITRAPAGVRHPLAHVLETAGRPSLRQVARLLRAPNQSYFVTRRLFDGRQISELLQYQALDDAELSARFLQLLSETRDYDPVNRISALEIQTYMLSTLLRDTDQMSMAHALEIRVPLIDHELVELVFSLPGDYKIDGVVPKPLLTRALNGAIPAECINRPKRGFELPFEVWLRVAFENEVRDVLLDPSIEQFLPFRKEGIANAWHNFRAGRSSWSRVWGLFVLIKWLQRHGIAAC